jgi:hypothetical protein
MSLTDAYQTAQERKKEGASLDTRFAKVQAADPDLARRVAEEEITLVMAEAELKERATAALREHDENFELHAKVTNRLWCYCNAKSLASLETSLTAWKADPPSATLACATVVILPTFPTRSLPSGQTRHRCLLPPQR